MTMRSVPSGELLRPAPSRSRWHEFRMGRFLERIERERGLRFEDYEDAWRWSVDDLDGFWREIWREFELRSHAPWTVALDPASSMPRAAWFPGARLNYAEHLLRGVAEHGDGPVLLARSQTRPDRDVTAAEFADEVGRIQAGLRRLGVGEGDRVVGYLPNLPETVAAYAAAAGLGAIWCSVPPEMGTRSVLERIEQLDPAVVIAVDGYRWGSKTIRRAEELEAIRAALPRASMVLLPYLDPEAVPPEGAMAWRELVAVEAEPVAVPVAFEHPLVILFSSGTTGRPKAIIHSHGGLLTEHMKAVGLHFGISPADTTFWYTTTGWMVWTLSVSSLLLGASMVLMDGDPNWPALDGEWSQWAVLERTRATYFVTGSAYLAASAHAGLEPGTRWDLTRVREIQCSGSPLAPDVAAWVYDRVGASLLLHPASGGTDICSGFLMGGPLTAVHAGEMACRPLGVAVDSWDETGTPVVGAPGELVCTRPMPSMPVGFWGDEGDARYREAYFETYPGVWRHGDWLIHTERGTWVITGRSDATLNRGGVRLGTAEYYAVLDGFPGLADSIVVHFEDPAGGMGTLVLVVASAGHEPGPETDGAIRDVLRTALSPRHVPDRIVWAPSIPRSRTGKRLEIPLKRLVQGVHGDAAIDPAVLQHPEHLAAVVALVREAIA